MARLRRVRGWSRVRVAGLAGVSTGTIKKLELGRVSTIEIQTRYRIATACGVTVVDLVPGLAVRADRMRGWLSSQVGDAVIDRRRERGDRQLHRQPVAGITSRLELAQAA